MVLGLGRKMCGGLAVLVASVACSAGGGGGSPVDNGGSGGTGGSGNAAGSGAVGAFGGSGGSSGSGATGSGGFAAQSGSGGGGGSGGGTCAEVAETAVNELQPADIVFALDNSGSMDEEAVFVQQNMNIFSTGLSAPTVNIDYHVVIISANSSQSNGVCIAPQLGSGNCPDDDNPPNFFHHDLPVASSNSLQLLVQEFDQYKHMLRTGASKHFVVVSDDNSSMSANEFNQQIVPLLQSVDSLYQKYTFHSIYGYTMPLFCLNNPDPCCNGLIPLTAEVGTVYRDLVQMTGGKQGNLCTQDFAPVFSAVTQAVVQGSMLACEWTIPTPSDGSTIDPGKVNVEFVPPGGSPQPLGFVQTQQDCANVAGGWYYDDNANPTKIYVCPQTCDAIRSAGSNAKINIKFGCKTEVAVPR